VIHIKGFGQWNADASGWKVAYRESSALTNLALNAMMKHDGFSTEGNNGVTAS